ncbi:Aldo/keto reductase [Aulographum hederae CBS 113979]|uniref:Aldo/keto reductase n=1 Tax=Aulographum hederae CBS 113979 TaxID=1176131 RepID=A0A6G1H6D1_9PEZI|nr:Aldo/keto reductase [Aulographum hederae CBS 113979]
MPLPKSFTMKVADGKTIEMPSPGFGTWASGDTGWCKEAVKTALKAGYRHLDCAWMYGVDHEVGAAIKESGIPRSEIFITTKFWPHFGAPEHVELCLDHCLRNLGLDYVDLYLAHWPYVAKPISRSALEVAQASPDATNEERGILMESRKPVVDWEHTVERIALQSGREGSFVPTWTAMQSLVRTGKTLAVGVSNFSIPDLEELLPHSAVIPISCNQIEAHPWFPNTSLIEFARARGIVTTCYSPFAGQRKDGATLLKDPTVVELAEKEGMDVGQLLQSWAVQRGTVPLGKSGTEGRIRRNFEVREVREETGKVLDGLEVRGGEGRTVDFSEGWGIPLFA